MALITKDGFERLKIFKEELLNEQKQAIEAVVIARGYGDFSENAELEAANNWLERVRMEIAKAEESINSAQIFSLQGVDVGKIGFGATVQVEDENGNLNTYTIVSEFEADLEQGKISVNSPIARALFGKSLGQECILKAPSGEKMLYIVSITYKD